MHGLRHLPTPGTPGHAALKIGAVAGVAGLQIALRRRAKHGAGAGETGAATSDVAHHGGRR